MTEKNNKDKDSMIVILAAIAGNIAVGVVKFIAAAITGSSAIMAEGIHSIVDSGNGIIVAWGLKASKKKPDANHPFGYGKELYFYSFIVALFIFALGGGVSIFKGITAFMNADNTSLGDPWINYIICIISILIEGTSFSVALKNILNLKGERSIFKHIRCSKDPSSFVVLFEDSAALLGLIVALFGIFLSHITDNPRYDAIASIVIGFILIAVSFVLIVETKGLLIGEGLLPDQVKTIVKIVEKDKDVKMCGQVLSLYMGPNDLIINLNVSFLNGVDEFDIFNAIDRIEHRIKDEFPEANRIFIESESFYTAINERRTLQYQLSEAEEDN